MNGPRILIVDDDAALARMQRRNLIVHGYEVATAGTGEDALRGVAQFQPDLILLDLQPSRMSGFALCKAVRGESAAPILVLSAHTDERTKVRVLDLGADDYLTTPFGMEELLARSRALLRRPALSAFTWGSPLGVGDLLLDPQTRRVSQGGMPLDLTPREFDVLCALMRHVGKVVPHRLLLSEVWGPEYGIERQYLRVFINRLRRKIELDPSRPCRILTEMGVGYQLVHSSCAA